MSNDLHLVIPALFWPDTSLPEIYRDLQLPALENLLARCSLTENESHGIESWLCEAFGVRRQQDWPVAPVTLQIDGSEEMKGAQDYWMRADPVHLRLEHDRVVLADSQVFRISREEAHELSGFLNRHFSAHGQEEIAFLPLQPNRWYFRVTRHSPASTHPVSQAINRDVTELLPFGTNSAFWRGLFNEIQMLLHEHPVNQSREARGEFTINSIWFWGGGVLPRTPACSYTHLWNNDIFAASLASICGISHADLPAGMDGWQHSVAAGRHLVLLDVLQGKAQYEDAYGWREGLKRLERDWFTPLEESLRQKRFDHITLTALGECTTKNFAASRGDLRKFWRRSKPVSTYAA